MKSPSILSIESSSSTSSPDDSSSTARKGRLAAKSSHSTLAAAMNSSHSAVVLRVMVSCNSDKVSSVILAASRKWVLNAAPLSLNVWSFEGINHPASHPISNLFACPPWCFLILHSVALQNRRSPTFPKHIPADLSIRTSGYFLDLPIAFTSPDGCQPPPNPPLAPRAGAERREGTSVVKPEETENVLRGREGAEAAGVRAPPPVIQP